jgi:mycothiol synthase
VKGRDEPVWVEVRNAAYKEIEYWWRATTVEEMLLDEERPNFDFDGRHIAEVDEEPVGIVHAHVDKLLKEKKGFIRTLCVVPEYRGRGVDKKLVELAVGELKKRGMNVVQTWTDHKRSDRVQLFEKMGFKLVRSESDMEIDLANIPSDIRENTNVTLRSLRKNVEEDIELLNRLINKSFKEHFNYRPKTVEETRHYLLKNTKLKEQQYFLAVLDQKSVGYIGIGIDEKYNNEKNVKAGFVLVIGVLKQHRQKGIGTRLVLHGLKTLKAKGMTKAMLDVDDLNPTKAINLYEKLGFKVAEKYLVYEKKL